MDIPSIVDLIDKINPFNSESIPAQEESSVGLRFVCTDID
jgi:phosphoribulokinase